MGFLFGPLPRVSVSALEVYPRIIGAVPEVASVRKQVSVV
jgi:hypothetical protein